MYFRIHFRILELGLKYIDVIVNQLPLSAAGNPRTKLRKLDTGTDGLLLWLPHWIFSWGSSGVELSRFERRPVQHIK